MVKVGDIIYFERYGILNSRQVVNRVTPKGLVKTSNHTMRLKGDSLTVINQGTWQATSAYIETEALKKQWHELELRLWIANNWRELTIEEIEALKAVRDKAE